MTSAAPDASDGPRTHENGGPYPDSQHTEPAFPTTVITPGICPFCGKQIPQANIFGREKTFCRNPHRIGWHVWRRKLATTRIIEATALINAELKFLTKG